MLQHKYHTKIDEQIEKISGQMSKDVVGKLVQVMMMVMMMMVMMMMVMMLMVMVVLLIKMIKAFDVYDNVGTGDGQNPVQAGDL